MGRYFTKRMSLLLTPIMLLPLLISSSSGEPVNSSKNGVHTAKEGELPILETLNLCKVFHEKTGCSASTDALMEKLATYGEADKDCLNVFKLLECSICKSGTPRICASFCDRVFESCSDAYFSSDDATNQVIVPCGVSKSIICGKACKWETNGTAFCNAMGFTVQIDDEEPCYGSKPSLEQPVVEEPVMKTRGFQLLQIYWLVTVIVMRTVCWLEIRGRYQREMRAQRERVVRNMNGIA